MDTPIRSIHVMAAVITDARGRILLARRDGTSDLAGLWEFPGGKREPGESSEDALVRELQEELDITVEVGPALMQVPQLYPNKRLRLDVRQVSAWQGKPKGHEGQALTWVSPDKLPRYSMPPADLPVVAALLQPDRYLITPDPGADDAAWLQALAQAVNAGLRRVQLRAPVLAAQDPARWQALARQAVAISAEVEWLIDGDIELARALGVGVHLRAAQLADLASRPLADEQRVGVSCNEVEQLQAAQALGCDFAVVEPVPKASGGTATTAPDWDEFEALREHSALPLYLAVELVADAAGIGKAREHGAQGIAATGALWPFEY